MQTDLKRLRREGEPAVAAGNRAMTDPAVTA